MMIEIPSDRTSSATRLFSLTALSVFFSSGFALSCDSSRICLICFSVGLCRPSLPNYCVFVQPYALASRNQTFLSHHLRYFFLYTLQKKFTVSQSHSASFRFSVTSSRNKMSHFWVWLFPILVCPFYYSGRPFSPLPLDYSTRNSSSPSSSSSLRRNCIACCRLHLHSKSRYVFSSPLLTASSHL